MKTQLCLVGVCALLTWSLAAAEAPPEIPKPGPAHARLDFFVGKWQVEGAMKENPFMPAGPFASTDTCKWFDGGFAVVCRFEGTGPAGQPTKGIGIIGYSAEEKAYTYYAVDNGPMAMVSVPKGTVEGDTWIYEDEATMGGATVKSRYTIRETSLTSYTFKWEMLGEDGSWLTITEGKAAKIPRD